MTGHCPARHRVFGHFAGPEINRRREMPDALDPGVTTLTDLLKSGGYRTAHFGKCIWAISNRTNTASTCTERRAFPMFPRGTRSTFGVRRTAPHCTADFSTRRWSSFEAHQASNSGEPFYVNAWFSDPHATLNPSQEQLDRVRQFHPKGVEFNGVAQIFYASVKEMDLQVGRFLKRLDELGLADDTIVVFSSDNGPEDFQIINAAHSGVGSAGPFRGRKRSIYEAASARRSSSAGRDTSRREGQRYRPSSAASISSRLWCKVAGVEAPEELKVDGEDMSDVLLGSDRTREKPLFWEWRYRVFGHILNRPPQLAIRDGDWKLLMNPDRSRVELYDIPKDPSELDNLAREKPGGGGTAVERLLQWNETLPESPKDPTAGENAYPFPSELGGDDPQISQIAQIRGCESENALKGTEHASPGP